MKFTVQQRGSNQCCRLGRYNPFYQKMPFSKKKEIIPEKRQHWYQY